MIIFNKKNDLLNFLNNERKNKSVGFVPTMGGLHSGHLQLVKLSLKECSITICSIFINPTQFNNINDFKKYPNTLSEDLSHLKQIGCEIVYNPDVYFIWGPSDLVNPDLKKIIEETNIKKSKNFDSRLSFFNLSKI